MNGDRERVRVVVSGLVQGVWFRAATQKEAHEFELTGWVRNRPDGGVELEAEGRPESLEELLSWLRDGPPQARVDAVEVSWIPAQADEQDFSIRR